MFKGALDGSKKCYTCTCFKKFFLEGNILSFFFLKADTDKHTISDVIWTKVLTSIYMYDGFIIIFFFMEVASTSVMARWQFSFIWSSVRPSLET